MRPVFIGLGSNQGDREANCFNAIDLMGQEIGMIHLRSSLYKTSPWGVENQPDFINMAIQLQTALNPFDTLKRLKAIELRLGRKETFRWGPREIDLDILFYDAEMILSETLIIPHPYAHKREFVLKPMVEIAPDWIHPTFKQSMKILYEEYLSHERTQPF